MKGNVDVTGGRGKLPPHFFRSSGRPSINQLPLTHPQQRQAPSAVLCKVRRTTVWRQQQQQLAYGRVENNLCQTARRLTASISGNLLRASIPFSLSTCCCRRRVCCCWRWSWNYVHACMHASRPGAQVTGLRWRRRRRGTVRSRDGCAYASGWLAGWRGVACLCHPTSNTQARHTDTCQAERWKRAVAEAVAREAKDKEARRCATPLTPRSPQLSAFVSSFLMRRRSMQARRMYMDCGQRRLTTRDRDVQKKSTAQRNPNQPRTPPSHESAGARSSFISSQSRRN
ncbi:uncharacterized protein J3D65DRAFT_248171 [Phyllosticta citribraziliensis]|uniref:Uncharacterized protein n=1 Tax=Phyllosticta citribraziliensis TaxID=989973 RepID=A0ABR1LZQ5_9PEZI